MHNLMIKNMQTANTKKKKFGFSDPRHFETDTVQSQQSFILRKQTKQSRSGVNKQTVRHDMRQ